MKKYIVMFGLTLVVGLIASNNSYSQVVWTPDGIWQSTTSNLSSDAFIRSKERLVAPVIRPFFGATGTYATRFDLGYAANQGAGLEMYRNTDPGRAGEFRFVYGVGDFGDVRFIHADGAGGFVTRMLLDKDGDLFLDGKLTSTEIEVKLDVWPDFVFADDYELMSLHEVESYIQQNRHLPNVPSEAQVLENGVNVGEMTSILLQKVEELTLHIIELNKRIEELEK